MHINHIYLSALIIIQPMDIRYIICVILILDDQVSIRIGTQSEWKKHPVALFHKTETIFHMIGVERV